LRVFDISRPLAPGAWVWPGDRPYDCGFSWRIAQGAKVNVGWVSMSCHTGTHMDAPLHLADGAAGAESIPLESCVGPCVVLPLSRLDTAEGAERVLVKAEGGAPSADQLSRMPRLRLFGTDGHSVDPMDSKTLDAHHALWKRGAVILEELDLSAVPDGEYQLVALPIRLKGMDAAPVRAILIER
jgi:arylformamidase